MKKLYSLCILLFSAVAAVYGQPCTPAGISTNPNAPIDPFFLSNIVNPSSPGTSFSINPFLNTFDWGAIAGADFKTIGIDLCTYWEFDNSIVLANPGDPCPLYYPMTSFMSDGMPSQFNYLKEPQANGLITDRDYHWEDGWELLWMNLGYLPDGTSTGGPHATGSPFQGNNYSATPDNIPYLIIYNRYRGIMRLVANVWDNRIKHQNLQVELIQSGGDGNLTGVLRCIENYDRPLSMACNVIRNISPRFQAVLFNQWMVADFQMSYDPCTCISQGKFDIEFSQFSEMDIEMIGREISTTQEIDAGNYTMNDFMNLSAVNTDNYEPGTMIYRSMADMIQQYQDKLDKYDQEMNDYNSLGNQLIRLGLDAGVDLLTVFAPELGGDDTKSEESKSFKKLLAKGMDFAAMEILPKTFDKPAKPTTPTATYTETAFKGTIGSTYFDLVGPLYMPGTFPTSYGSGQPGLTPFNYPAYNEVLGQFALLQKPKIKKRLFEDQEWYTCLHFGGGTCNSASTNPGDSYPGWNYIYFESEHTQNISLKLHEPLKFALNPALDFDFDATSVDVAFILTFKGMSGVNDTDLRIHRAVTGSDFNMAHWFRPCANQNNCENIIVLETEWFSAGDAMGKVFKGEIVTTANGDESAGFNYQTYHPDNIKMELEKIEMKLLVDMHFETVNSRNQKNNSTQAYTYLIWERTPNTTSFEPTADIISGSFGAMNDLIHFNEITLGPWGNFINGSDGNYSLVKAHKVMINSTIQSNASLSYGIDARDQIRIVPGAILRPNGRLRIIDDPLAEFGLPASNDFIIDFCQQNIPEPYQSNTASRPLMERLSDRERELEMRKQMESAKVSSSSLSLYPNPARSELTVQSQGAGIDRLHIYDTSGRPVLQATPGGQTLHRLDIGALAPGVYIVRATCGDEVLTEKLVVAR